MPGGKSPKNKNSMFRSFHEQSPSTVKKKKIKTSKLKTTDDTFWA